jgi:hypothetical protein
VDGVVGGATHDDAVAAERRCDDTTGRTRLVFRQCG